MVTRISPEEYFTPPQQIQENENNQQYVYQEDRTIIYLGLLTLGIIACVSIVAIALVRK